MEGGATAAKIVVVKGGQVIMDEAEGVDQLNRHPSGQAVFPPAAHSLSTPPGKHGTQPLPPAHDGIPRGIPKMFRQVDAIQIHHQCLVDPLDDRVLVHSGSYRGVLGWIDEPGLPPLGGFRMHTSDPVPFAVIEQALSIFRAGGWVMYPLLFLSMISLTLVVERATYWVRNFGNGRRFALYLSDLQSGNRRRAVERSREDRGPLGRLLRLLDNGGSDAPITEGVAVSAIESLRPPVERFAAAMGVIIAAAPLLGILGTVTGIIESFGLLGAASGVSDPTVVAGGVAEALYTTAFGLCIALITLFPHALFKARSERMLARLESLAAAMVG